MILAVTLALFASIFCFLKIRLCDFLSDRLTPGNEKEDIKEGVETRKTPFERKMMAAKHAILEKVISANGILVGFAWERCFDTAVKDLAMEVQIFSSGLVPNTLMRVILAGFCSLLIVPAWYLYILPMANQNGWRTGCVIPNLDEMERLHKRFEEWCHDVNLELGEKIEGLESCNQAAKLAREKKQTNARERRVTPADD